MLKIKKPAPTVGGAAIKKQVIPSIIAADMNVLGNIVSDGPVDFAGSLNGNIRCQALTIRATGTITGEIQADSMFIYGRVKGMLRAREVHLFSTCHIEGIIMHEAISIEDGAFIDGSCKRTDKPRARKAFSIPAMRNRSTCWKTCA